MHNIVLVAKREYLEQVRSRAFRLSTIAMPLLLVVVVGIMYLSGLSAMRSKHVVVAADNAALAADIRDQLLEDKKAKNRVEAVSPADAAARAQMVTMVEVRAIDGFLWVEAGPGQEPKATWVSKSSGDFMTESKISTVLNTGLVHLRLAENGIGAAQADKMLEKVKVKTHQVNREGVEVESNSLTSFYKGYLMALLLTLTTMVYGMGVARSVIQEKTSRIFEVMLAIVKPSDMLAGKLIGTGAVGLTQIAIWGATLAAAAAYPMLATMMAGKLDLHFTWVEGALFVVYFLLGYLLNAALFAGLAATCETEQELQMFTPLSGIPVWLGFGMMVIVMNDPASLLSIAVSLFPATAPIVMILRMSSEMPPVWEFAASIALLIASIAGTLWFSARIYRIGILMYGKRPTLPEILRWLRYS